MDSVQTLLALCVLLQLSSSAALELIVAFFKTFFSWHFSHGAICSSHKQATDLIAHLQRSGIVAQVTDMEERVKKVQ
jgi:hypothetical protein